MVYADNAATTQLYADVFEKIKYYLLNDYGNASQPYSFSRTARKALKEARITIADCIGALPEEIYFTSGGTESDNWAIKGLMEYRDSRVTLTSDIEHHAVLNACKTLSRLGYLVSYLPVEKYGIVLPVPICELVEVAHAHGALFHTDAVQAVGHIPIDVKILGIDMLSASGHKFNAPMGVEFLYIKKGVDILSYANGGVQESGLRAGTENVASIVAMAAELKMNCDDMFNIKKKLENMERIFIQTLDGAGIDYVRNGADEHVPGNINISIKHTDGEMLLHRLDLKGICISTGSACDSVNQQISHVIRAIAVPEKYASGTIRISFGRMNEDKDASIVAQSLIDIFKKIVS